MSDEISLGTVTRPQGIRGEVRVHLSRDGWVLLEAEEATVGGIRRRIVASRGTNNPDVAVLHFQGIDHRNAAEALRDAEVTMEMNELPELQAGELWEHQVTGVAVYAGERHLGTGVTIVNYGASDLLVVHSEREEWLIPLLEETLESVSADRIMVVLPDGLEAQQR